MPRVLKTAAELKHLIQTRMNALEEPEEDGEQGVGAQLECGVGTSLEGLVGVGKLLVVEAQVAGQ